MLTCDIFCTVIDNYGDIGFCWRLARQLAHEYDWQVRLWVDDLTTFAQLCPTFDLHAAKHLHAEQIINQVSIKPWLAELDAHSIGQVADIVLETFGCELPAAYLANMRERDTQQQAPIWINLEYLSAEAWVVDCHLRPSPDPRSGLTKTYFFPGLQAGTGGLLKERNLFQNHRAFTSDANARAAFWQTLNLPPPAADATTISLFAYENSALHTLLHSWSASLTPILCIVPEGRLSNALADFFEKSTFTAGAIAKHGNLTVYSIPFLEQSQYDRLLWACDMNFVRGEDSFVRAQWAQRSLVWHIYPQAENAHWPKLEAALIHYIADLPEAASTALVHFWRAWNGIDETDLDWQDFWQHREILAQQAKNWAQKVAAVGDLCTHLVKFCETQLQYAAI